MIFFAIIITSVYDRFAKGALRVLISLLLISYKSINMAFRAWYFPGVGPYHTFLGSTVGFLSELLGPTVEQLQLPHPQKKRKKKTNVQGRWAWLKLTELLKRGCVRRSRGTLEGGWIWGILYQAKCA